MANVKDYRRNNNHEKIKVIFKFPENNTDDEKIKKEVNCLMSSALREYMQKKL